MTASTERNKELARTYATEIWEEGNLDLVDELFAKDQVFQDPISSGEEKREDFKEFIRSYRSAFPNLQYEIEGILADEDTVAFWGRSSGTHKGEFMGVEPTGNEFDVMGINVLRIEDGKVVERWAYVNIFAMLQQLDIDPSDMNR